MDIQITGRNLTVNDVLREYVNSRLGPVVADHPRIESCHVILAHEKYRHTAEVVVQGRDKLRAEAAETTDDMYASIDAATLKIDKQLRKSHDKMIERHHERQRLADVERKSQT
jgi:putative sigma-54 modulation protein